MSIENSQPIAYNWAKEIAEAQEGPSEASFLQWIIYKASLLWSHFVTHSRPVQWCYTQKRTLFSAVPLTKNPDGPKIYVGGLPQKVTRPLWGDRDDMRDLKSLGINCVLSINELFETRCTGPILRPLYHEEYTKEGILHLQISVPDFRSASIEAINKGVAFILWNVQKGKTPLIHCKSGKGRSVQFATAYLMKHAPLEREVTTVESTVQRIQRYRPQARLNTAQRYALESISPFQVFS